MQKYKVILVGIFILVGFFCIKFLVAKKSETTTSATFLPAEKTLPQNTEAVFSFVSPLDRPKERVTKKFFGTYVTPKNSPVSPEKFTGFHTGVDFEIFPEEIEKNVYVKAVCAGELVLKKYVSGYGGVVVQKCMVETQEVWVVYGHLELSSISAVVGKQVQSGEEFSVLGATYSQETDGERKHLHLSVYTGSQINLKGYVQSKIELSSWLDPRLLLGF